MRTSLNEIALIEGYLSKTITPEDALLMEAKAILDPAFATNILAQQESYRIVKLYSRKALRAELETIHNKLFIETRYSSFVRGIKQLFRQG